MQQSRAAMIDHLVGGKKNAVKRASADGIADDDTIAIFCRLRSGRLVVRAGRKKQYRPRKQYAYQHPADQSARKLSEHIAMHRSCLLFR